MNTMNRRTALAALATAPTAVLAIQMKEPPTSHHAYTLRPSPVMQAYARYQEYSAFVNTMPMGMTDAELAPHYNRLKEIEDEMMAIPSATAQDFAAKVIVDTCEGSCLSSWDESKMWKEARSLTQVFESLGTCHIS